MGENMNICKYLSRYSAPHFTANNSEKLFLIIITAPVKLLMFKKMLVPSGGFLDFHSNLGLPTDGWCVVATSKTFMFSH